MAYNVAPFAGAWIEIERVRLLRSHGVSVAPFAGAWIEIVLRQGDD